MRGLKEWVVRPGWPSQALSGLTEERFLAEGEWSWAFFSRQPGRKWAVQGVPRQEAWLSACKPPASLPNTTATTSTPSASATMTMPPPLRLSVTEPQHSQTAVHVSCFHSSTRPLTVCCAAPVQHRTSQLQRWHPPSPITYTKISRKIVFMCTLGKGKVGWQLFIDRWSQIRLWSMLRMSLAAVGFCEISKATSSFDREDVFDKVSALSILMLSFKMEENIKYREWKTLHTTVQCKYLPIELSSQSFGFHPDMCFTERNLQAKYDANGPLDTLQQVLLCLRVVHDACNVISSRFW